MSVIAMICGHAINGMDLHFFHPPSQTLLLRIKSIKTWVKISFDGKKISPTCAINLKGIMLNMLNNLVFGIN
jgi:hypothetical protein